MASKSNKELLDILNKDYSYPDLKDDDFQTKLYEKREFHYNRATEPVKIEKYADLKKFRDMSCTGKIKSLQPHQLQLGSYITPDTPFKGVVVFWDMGSGKTCGTIGVTENFTDVVYKYGTKIHILVPGRLLKETWKDEILKCTGDKYLKDVNTNMGYVGEEEKELAIRNAKHNISQYYKIMSHVGFYKKVLGQKIIEHVKDKDSDKINKIYRKNLQGDYERDVATDRIESLDNTVLVVDEAHRVVNNEYGLAIKTIIKNSKNLRVLLLTGTPMKNLADDIVELVNYLRPENDQIDRDLVFTSNKDHLMEFKPGGKEYLSKMVSGYISYSRGASHYLYGLQVDMGKIPNGLLYTTVTECEMEKFQENTYRDATDNVDDTLYRKSVAASNFAFPVYNTELKTVMGKYGIEGINACRMSLKTNKKELFDGLRKLGIEGINDLIVDNDKLKTIRGEILKKNNLKHFSTKFHEALELIDQKVNEKAGLIFVSSNFVKIGTEMFEQVLLENGYLEYDPQGNYQLLPNTQHYLTGEKYVDFLKRGTKEVFYPATYMTVTGESEDNDDAVPEEKKKIIDSVFSNPDNKHGKFLKIIVGSKVIAEGITLKMLAMIIILDTSYHLGQVAQVAGRGVRFCAHVAVSTEENPYPEILIYKLIVKIKNSDQLSTEGILYQKAERKYILVKDTERVLQESAFDCPANYNNNISKQDISDYANCIKPLDYAILSDKRGKVQCPMKCNFQDCHYVCKSKTLNLKYYDKNSMIYRKIAKENLDFSTFTSKLAKNDIKQCKEKIKEMFRFKYVYNLQEIIDYVKTAFIDKNDLFEDFFCYKALDELVLVSENDFNNFTDIIYDKFNVPGYLIYRKRYYIFQPLNQNEDVPMYYRTNYVKDLVQELTLNQYFNNTLDSQVIDEFKSLENDDINTQYDFDSILEYYDSKAEAKYVGIIDKPLARKKTLKVDNNDVFKIREHKKKNINKKRGVGIPSLKGSVCYSSKDKNYLIKIAKYLCIKTDFTNDTRINICEAIRLRMLYLEKYSTTKDDNKLTWVIIPYNHPKYKFPLNLEDHIQMIKSKLSEKINVKISIKESGNGIFEDVRNEKFKKYTLTFLHKDDWNIYIDFITELGFKLNNDTWTLVIE